MLELISGNIFTVVSFSNFIVLFTSTFDEPPFVVFPVVVPLGVVVPVVLFELPVVSLFVLEFVVPVEPVLLTFT